MAVAMAGQVDVASHCNDIVLVAAVCEYCLLVMLQDSLWVE